MGAEGGQEERITPAATQILDDLRGQDRVRRWRRDE
jgi:hypothetical protein